MTNDGWRPCRIPSRAPRAVHQEIEADGAAPDEVYVSCGNKSEAADAVPADAAGVAPGERQGRARGLRHGPDRGHAEKDRPVVSVIVERGGPRIVAAGPSVDRETVVGVFTTLPEDRRRSL